MAEQKEKTISTITRENLIYDAKDTQLHDYRWEFKTTLDQLGNKGKQRLTDFMESIGFLCEDMPDECKRHFFPKKSRERLDELSCNLAVGACLCLGYDCVKKGREIIVFLDGLE